MRTLIVVFLFLILPVDFATPVAACTVFKVTRTGTTLVGNNEDDNHPATKVWFLAPEKGKYGRVFFGYSDCIPQGGMNEKGLFFDWVADNPSDDWQKDPGKLNYPGSISELILEEAATLEEALEIYDRYNETAFLKSRTLLVDKTGASAVVRWKDGRLQVERSPENFQAIGYGRGTAVDRLKNPEPLSVEGVRSILVDCLQRGEYRTLYSNVYDLAAGVVYVYLFDQDEPCARFDLREELKKGHHYYDLPSLPEQLTQPLMTDAKTRAVARIDPAILPSYVGRYLIGDDYLLTFSIEDNRLVVQAPDVSPIEIFPGSSTEFFLRSLDSHLRFSNPRDGLAEQVTLYVRGRGESIGRRVR
jgi:hypothetical protein